MDKLDPNTLIEPGDQDPVVRKILSRFIVNHFLGDCSNGVYDRLASQTFGPLVLVPLDPNSRNSGIVFRREDAQIIGLDSSGNYDSDANDKLVDHILEKRTINPDLN